MLKPMTIVVGWTKIGAWNRTTYMYTKGGQKEELGIEPLAERRGGEADNSTQGCGKFHPGFWKIPPRVRGQPRLLENPTQGFVKVLGHNLDLVIEIDKSKKKV